MIHWEHTTPIGVTVEEISGGGEFSPRVWKLYAFQIFGESGADYREVGHHPNGAPYIEDSEELLSISHTKNFMVFGRIPRPGGSSDVRMGIDTECADRAQAAKVVGRILSEEERALIAAYAKRLETGDAHHAPMPEEQAQVEAAILAWTLKEALYKAALFDEESANGIDYSRDLRILSMPEIASSPLIPHPELGRGEITVSGETIPMILYAYRSEDAIVAIALAE